MSTHHEDSDSYRVLPGDSQVEVWKSVEEFERDNNLGNKEWKY